MENEINIDGVIYVRKEKQEKLLPFDIEKARAGAKVVTRDGRDVVIYDFDRASIDGFVVVGKAAGKGESDVVITWLKDGRYLESPIIRDEKDLFILNTEAE